MRIYYYILIYIFCPIYYICVINIYYKILWIFKLNKNIKSYAYLKKILTFLMDSLLYIL